MASRYWTATTGNNWSYDNTPTFVGSNWTSDAARLVPASKPAPGHLVYFDANALCGNCTIDENIPMLDSLLMTGYVAILAWGARTISVDYDAVLAGTITASAGAALNCYANFSTSTILPATMTVTLNGPGTTTVTATGNLASLIVAGNRTYSTDQYWGGYTYTSGTLAQASKVSYLTQNGTVSWSASAASANVIYHLSIAGFTMTFGNTIQLSKFTATAGAAFVPGSYTMAFYFALTSFWNCDVQVNFPLLLHSAGNIDTGKAIDTTGVNASGEAMIVNRSGGTGITATGDIDLTAGKLTIANVSSYDKLLMSTYALTCGAVALGGSTDDITLDLGSGAHSLASVARVSGATGVLTLALGTSVINLSGIFNGAGITTSGSAVASEHCQIKGGTLTAVSNATNLAAIDATAGAATPVSSTSDGGHTAIGTAKTSHATYCTTQVIVILDQDLRTSFPKGAWVYHSTDKTWYEISSVAYGDGGDGDGNDDTLVTMVSAATAQWDNLSVQAYWRNNNIWFTGCNGGHQVLGSGFIGSARAA